MDEKNKMLFVYEPQSSKRDDDTKFIERVQEAWDKGLSVRLEVPGGFFERHPYLFKKAEKYLVSG